jgi:ribosomal protein L11 methyltransferase
MFFLGTRFSGRDLVHIWRKFMRPADISPWIVRVSMQVGADRLALISPANGQAQRLEVYCERAAEAHGLVERFGGRVRSLPDDRWQPAPATARGRPLAIGAELLVTAWPDEFDALRGARPGKTVLCIPAAMAFGTGEHATTAMCLRLLTDSARRRRHDRDGWAMLDLGTGSGILALSARLLGAKRVAGLDNDGQAVRTAKENARLNGFAAPAVRFTRADLLRWAAPAGKQWPVITANLFSELLIRLLPAVIVPALAPDGELILSGVLAEQQDDVEAAIRRSGLATIQVKRRGHWRAFHCRLARAL